MDPALELAGPRGARLRVQRAGPGQGHPHRRGRGAGVEHGAAGVVVSNHGGRQLDCVAATADALPEVVEAVDGRGTVLVDGGIRRGIDVAIALALGADAVLVGRPALWGLAVGGEAGARRVLELLRDGARAGAGALRLRLAGRADRAPTCSGHRPRPYIRPR